MVIRLEAGLQAALHHNFIWISDKVVLQTEYSDLIL